MQMSSALALLRYVVQMVYALAFVFVFEQHKQAFLNVWPLNNQSDLDATI